MIQPATPQLLDLAAEMRPDWDRDQLSQALVAAKNADWSWPRTFLETARLLCDEQAGPRDLTAAARGPLAPVTDPGFQAAVADEARAELERIRDQARRREQAAEAEREAAS